MRPLFIITLVLTLPSAWVAAADLFEPEKPPRLGMIEIDAAFPGVWLPSAEDGRPMSISNFRGRRVVLHVFASWSARCRDLLPRWHKATREYRASGKLSVVGIVEEQRSDRALLFMRWKGMDWPLVEDRLNLLGVWLVPITVLIDEYGIVRGIPPGDADPDRTVREFLAAQFEPQADPADTPPRPGTPPPADGGSSPEEWRTRGDHLMRWGGADGLDSAITAYRHAIELDPGDDASRFRLGVAFRARYDSGKRRDGDFEAAVYHWFRALSAHPDRQIWRRRIQVYGTRSGTQSPLDDWIPGAEKALEAGLMRGRPTHRVEPPPASFRSGRFGGQ
jgi:hypothetical protein